MLSNGTAVLDLQIDDGTVNIDRNALIRRTCSLTLTDPTGTLVASDVASVLTPFGTEFSVWYGVTFPDGSKEMLLQGIFGIVDRNIDDSGADLVITLDGADRGRAVQRDPFTDVYTIPPNTNVGLAIQSIILSRNISPLAQQFNFAPTVYTTPSTPLIYSGGSDPLQACVDLATGVGYELFLDPNGVWTLIPVPDPTLQPISWSYDEAPTNLVTDLQPAVSADNVYSRWVRELSGTSATEPIQGVAVDDDPTSETWIGTFGEVTDYQSSSLYTSQAQAQDAAEAAKRTNRGAARTITFSAIVKPDSDVDNVIEATRVRADVGPGSLWVIDSLSIGLSPSGLMQPTCRAVA